MGSKNKKQEAKIEYDCANECGPAESSLADEQQHNLAYAGMQYIRQRRRSEAQGVIASVANALFHTETGKYPDWSNTKHARRYDLYRQMAATILGAHRSLIDIEGRYREEYGVTEPIGYDL